MTTAASPSPASSATSNPPTIFSPSGTSGVPPVGSELSAAFKRGFNPEKEVAEVTAAPEVKPLPEVKPATEVLATTQPVPEVKSTAEDPDKKWIDEATQKFKTGESQAAFGRLKDSREALRAKLTQEVEAERAQVTALKAELQKAAELRAQQPGVDPATKEQLAAAQKERDEAVALIERLRVEESPRFKQKFDAQAEAILARAKTDLVGTEVDPEAFARVVAMTPSKEKSDRLAELMDGLSAPVAAKLGARITTYEDLQAQRQEAIANHRQFALQQQQEGQQQHAKMIEKHQQTFDSVFKEVGLSIPVLGKIDGNEAWNAEVDQIKNMASDFWLKEQTPETLAKVTLAGAALPKTLQLLDQTYRALDSAQKKLKRIEAATAPVNTQNPPGSPGAKTAEPTIFERFRQGAEAVVQR